MTYEVEIQFTGWATKTVQVPAVSQEEARVFALAIAQATPSDELAWILEDTPYDFDIREA
jgi:hypothetical protein|tara:strand:- start:7515 stop:7694 length:180 start_codon:yes stop_codon:yes gene_type:complete